MGFPTDQVSCCWASSSQPSCDVLTDEWEELVGSAGHEGEQQASRSRSETDPSMYAVTGDDDRCPRTRLEFFTPAVEAEPAFEYFKDLFAFFVIVQRRPDEWWDVCFDDREGAADIAAVYPQGHLLARQCVEPIQVIG
jgi:hypothetical protein